MLVAIALVGAAVVEAMGLLLMVGNPPVALALAAGKRALLACAYAAPWRGWAWRFPVPCRTRWGPGS